MKKAAVISLGCAKNLVDSEVMLGYLAKNGYAFVTDLLEADVIVVNTCGFIQPARQESLDVLANAVEAKRKADGIKVVAAGCYVERNRDELLTLFPEIDYWTGVSDFDKIVKILEDKSYLRSRRCFLYDHRTPRLISTPTSWAYIKISEGCAHACSFCAIPQIKGPYRSRPVQSIVEEAIRLGSSGVKEINLVSQDSTYFGRDLGLKDGLTTLLEQLLKAEGVEWIRVLYGYPEEISDSLLEIIHEEKICSYLDIPFQHADTFLIQQMRRGLDGQRALRLIQKIRSKLPEVALRTSLIVGFPGEGDKEYGHLLEFVRVARFDHLGVFTYSQEEGTACFSLGDPIKESTKQERRDKILELQAEISYQKNRRFIGQKMKVLAEGHLEDEPHILVGRTSYQAPEVDGVVFIEETKTRDHPVGAIQNVEITDSGIYDLSAKGIE